MILGDKPVIFEVVLSQLVPEQDWGKTHMKASKNCNNAFGEERLAHIRTIVVSLGGKLTYLFICLYEIAPAKVCGDFWSVDLILLLMALFFVCGFVELLGLCMLLLLMALFWLFVSSL